jgi:tetratricopeptide (TPR) repeat protein
MQAGDKPGVVLASNAYLASVSKPYSADDLAYIMQMTTKTSDAGFAIIKENAGDIDKAMGPRMAENKMMGIIYNEAIAPAVSGQQPTPDWMALQSRVAPFGSLGEEILLRAKTIHYINHPDWQQFVEAADEYIGKYGEHIRSEELNDFAWKAFENIDNKEALNKAVKWSQLSVKEKEEPGYLDTYANLLYKSGRTQEAISVQEKAVSLSNGNADLKQTLEKMKKGEPTWK